MPSVIERASTGRAKCRACGQAIARGDERFGEALPSSYGEGESLFWFHVPCAACARPESVLPVLGQSTLGARDRQALAELAQDGVKHGRLPRILRAERASSGRARCRHCGELIERGAWRLALQIFEEGRFMPMGTIHADCAVGYFESEPAVARLRLPSNQLHEGELAEVVRVMRAGGGSGLEAKGLVKAGAEAREVEPTRKTS